MKTYRVWTEQINADMIDVKADSEEEAQAKAIRYWRRSIGWPRIADTREQPPTGEEGTR